MAWWLAAGLELTSRQKTVCSPPRRRRRRAAVPRSLGPARRRMWSPASRPWRTWADFLVACWTIRNWKVQKSMNPRPPWRGNPLPPPAPMLSPLASGGLSAVSWPARRPVAKRLPRPAVVSCTLGAAGGPGGGPAQTGRWGPDLGPRPRRRAHSPSHQETKTQAQSTGCATGNT